MALPPNPGVPLAHYRQHKAGVRLTCLGCMHRRELPLEAVIERLKARGLGDETTGIMAVADFVRRPCPRCGGERFETAPAFPIRAKGEVLEGPNGHIALRRP
jgi:hypothetical protein